MLSFLVLALLFPFGSDQSITQSTSGWCSPTVAATTGNVRIICQGVDPRALRRLNELLDRKDIELNAKIREANDWAEKYHELESQISRSSLNEEKVAAVRGLLEKGDFAGAGSLLDASLSRAGSELAAIAQLHFLRSQLSQLELDYDTALVHIEIARRLVPESDQYSYTYGFVLMSTGRLEESEQVFRNNLLILRKKNDPLAGAMYIPSTLAKLAVIYVASDRWQDAEQALTEVLSLCKSSCDNRSIARALTTRALVFAKTSRLDAALRDLNNALSTYRALPQHSIQDDREIASSLDNMATCYVLSGDLSRAETAQSESIQWQAKAKCGKVCDDEEYRYRVNLGDIYRLQDRTQDVVALASTAIEYYKRQGNNARLGNVYALLADTYSRARYVEKSLSFRRKAISSYQNSFQTPEVRESLADNLRAEAEDYTSSRRMLEATQSFKAAAELYADLRNFDRRVEVIWCLIGAASAASQVNPSDSEPLLKRALAMARALNAQPHLISLTLNNLGALYRDQGRETEAESAWEEGVKVARSGSLKRYEAQHVLLTLLINLSALKRTQGRIYESRQLDADAFEIAKALGSEYTKPADEPYSPSKIHVEFFDPSNENGLNGKLCDAAHRMNPGLRSQECSR